MGHGLWNTIQENHLFSKLDIYHQFTSSRQIIMIITDRNSLPLAVALLLINGVAIPASHPVPDASKQTKNLFQHNASQWINENEGLLVFSFCLLFKWVCVCSKISLENKTIQPASFSSPPNAVIHPPNNTPFHNATRLCFLYSLWLVRSILLFSRMTFVTGRFNL